MISRNLAFSLLAAACAFLPISAIAETVTTITTVEQKQLQNGQLVNFMEFDLNRDGMLSMPEIGTKLFYLFDRDGNVVIDNVEFNRKSILTIIPMEKKELTVIDYNDDGTSDVSSYKYEDFIQESHLMRFDAQRDGLSPADFIEHSFLQLDDNNDKAVDVEEWKEAYLESVLPVNEPERYNY